MTNSSAQEMEPEEQKGKQARQKTVSGAVSKAIKGLAGGSAKATSVEKRSWAEELIPRSTLRGGHCTKDVGFLAANPLAWGGGDINEAGKEMRDAGRVQSSMRRTPWVKVAPLPAVEPTGERHVAL